jgi:Ca-activated chloride channel family protein
VASLNRLQEGAGKRDSDSKKGFISSKLFPRPEEAPSLSHQAIILLTDGGNNAGFVDPVSAAKLAASRGVKIYAIGIGTPEGIPLVYVDPLGRRRYALDDKGEVLKDAVDQKTLGQVAALSGGKFFLASSNYSLQAVLDEIAGLEKRDQVTVTNWEYQEWAPYFLLAAFVILFLDTFLGMTFLRTLP